MSAVVLKLGHCTQFLLSLAPLIYPPRGSRQGIARKRVIMGVIWTQGWSSRNLISNTLSQFKLYQNNHQSYLAWALNIQTYNQNALISGSIVGYDRTSKDIQSGELTPWRESLRRTMPVGRISTSIRGEVKKSVILKARSAPMCGGIRVKL